jgi:hypothetical protein
VQALVFTGTDRYAVAAAASHNNLLHSTYLVWTASPDPADGSRYFFRKTVLPSTLRRQFLHSGANISGAIIGTGTWNCGATRSEFAAHTATRGVPNFIAGIFTGTGVATDQKILLGTHRIPASEPASYLFRNGGTGVTNDSGATLHLGNRHLFDEPAGTMALFAWYNRVLRLDEIHDFQFDPFSHEHDTDCVMFYVFDVPSNIIRDRSGKGNHATGALASIATQRAIVPVPGRYFVRHQPGLVLPAAGTPVEASLASGCESLGAVAQVLVNPTESIAPVALAQAAEWEQLAAALLSADTGIEALAAPASNLEKATEWLATIAATQQAADESLGAPVRTVVVPWEAGGSGGFVEASQGCAWESGAFIASSEGTPHESLYLWPWGEPTTKRVALFVLASEQVPGQTVVSRIGPNGWLGDSPGDAVDDPTLDQNPPARWVMGQVFGPQISFGQVLQDILDSAKGFTIVAPIEVSAITARNVLVWKKFTLPSTEGPFCQLAAVSGSYRLQVQAFYDEETTNIDFATASEATVESPGRHVVGYSFDRALPRASRHQLWFNGASIPRAFFQQGAGGDDLSIGAPNSELTIGGDLASFRDSPESAHALIVVEGVLSPQTHANMAQWFRDGGWTPSVESSADAPWESLESLELEEAVATEQLAGVAAAPLMPWEADGTLRTPSWLEFSVHAYPSIDGSTHAGPALDGDVHANSRDA